MDAETEARIRAYAIRKLVQEGYSEEQAAALVRQREQTEARRKRLKAAGICYRCGRAPAAKGRVYCEACAKRATENRRKRKAAIKAAKEESF